jgi:hypothetical protein
VALANLPTTGSGPIGPPVTASEPSLPSGGKFTYSVRIE